MSTAQGQVISFLLARFELLPGHFRPHHLNEVAEQKCSVQYEHRIKLYRTHPVLTISRGIQVTFRKPEYFE